MEVHFTAARLSSWAEQRLSGGEGGLCGSSRQSGVMFELLALPRTSKCALQYCAQQFNAAVDPPPHRE